MSDSYASYKEDQETYLTLCKLLGKVPRQGSDFYHHLEELKSHPNIVWKNYHYQLKEPIQ